MSLSAQVWHAFAGHSVAFGTMLLLLGALSMLIVGRLDGDPLRWTLRVVLVVVGVLAFCAAFQAPKLIEAAMSPLAPHPVAAKTLQSHGQLAGVVPWMFLGVLVIDLAGQYLIKGFLSRLLYALALVVATAVVVLTAQSGTTLVYDVGAGVQAPMVQELDRMDVGNEEEAMTPDGDADEEAPAVEDHGGE